MTRGRSWSFSLVWWTWVKWCPNDVGMATYLFVADILQCVWHNLNAHVNQIRRSHLEDLFGELLAIFINFFYSHRSHNCTLMSFKRYKCNMLDLRFGFSQKLFASSLWKVIGRVSRASGLFVLWILPTTCLRFGPGSLLGQYLWQILERLGWCKQLVTQRIASLCSARFWKKTWIWWSIFSQPKPLEIHLWTRWIEGQTKARPPGTSKGFM